jgi:hypothetical protein
VKHRPIFSIASIGAIVLLALLALAALLYWLNTRIDETQSRTEAHEMVQKSLQILDEYQQQIRSVAMVLAQNAALTGALKTDDRAGAIAAIKPISHSDDPFLGRLRYQVHTAGARAFVRSWDWSDHGQPLEAFRQGVERVRQNPVPTVSVELGRLLNIKAVAPVLSEGRLVGSVEVIAGFNHWASKLAEASILLTVLMDADHLQTATAMADAPQIGPFVQAGSPLPPLWQARLERVDWSTLKRRGFWLDEEALYAATPLLDYEGDFLALAVLIRPREAEAIATTDWHRFFLGQRARDLPAGVQPGLSRRFEQHTLPELIDLRSQVAPADRAHFNRALMQKAQGLSREELVRKLLLEQSITPRAVEVR